MWTDTMNRPERATCEASARPAGRYQTSYRPISPDLAAHYVARGRALRAQAIAGATRRLSRRVRALFPGPSATAPPPEPRPLDTRSEDAVSALAGDLRPSLTAIRASAEALRDNPDIDSLKRRRFLDIVLIEEARLEVLTSRLLAAAKAAPGARLAGRDGPGEADLAKLEPAAGRCG
jgi:signal transduction histidine kinase